MLDSPSDAERPRHGYRDVTFDEMVAAYTEQIHGLVGGGVDSSCPRPRSTRWSSRPACSRSTSTSKRQGVRLPVMVSGTIFDGGVTLSAQTVEAFWASVSHFDCSASGSTAPLGVDQMRPYVENLAEIAPVFISCYPNAGMPTTASAAFRVPADRTTWPGRPASSPRTAG